MVEILCPHCEGEIELDDDASGEFECPLCEGEFEWNVPAVSKKTKSTKSISASQLVSHPIQWAGLALSVVMLIILIMSLSAVYYTASDSGEELEFKLTSFNEISRSGNVDEAKYSEVISNIEEQKASPMSDSADDIEYQYFIDMFKSWRTAGIIANILFIISLIACAILVISRIFTILDNGDFLEIPDGIYSITQTGNKILPFVISGLMLIGILLFMIIAPTNSILFDDIDEKGFTAFTWMCLFLPMIYSIFTKFEIDYS